MDGQPTSGGMTARIPASWRAFGAFVRRPALPPRAAGSARAGLAAIARLYPLDILVMVGLIAAMGALTLVGFELPAHALESLEIGPLLIAFVVVGAPLGEEILFRGWLSGRPGHVFGLLIAIGGGGLAALAAQALPAPGAGFAALAGIALGTAGVVLSLWFGRSKPAWSWFERHFGWFYFASALAFASIHLVNFGAASAALLPLTLPQFFLGLMLGYLRVHYGLWAAILFHAAHNALFIGVVLAAGGAA